MLRFKSLVGIVPVRWLPLRYLLFFVGVI